MEVDAEEEEEMDDAMMMMEEEEEMDWEGMEEEDGGRAAGPKQARHMPTPPRSVPKVGSGLVR